MGRELDPPWTSMYQLHRGKEVLRWLTVRDVLLSLTPSGPALFCMQDMRIAQLA